MSFEWLDLLASTSRFRSARQSARSATSPRESSARSGCSSMWIACAGRFGDRTYCGAEHWSLCCLELRTRFTLAVEPRACCRRSSFGRYFKHLRGEFDLAADAEITLECAPGQLSDETLDELLAAGDEPHQLRRAVVCGSRDRGGWPASYGAAVRGGACAGACGRGSTRSTSI